MSDAPRPATFSHADLDAARDRAEQALADPYGDRLLLYLYLTPVAGAIAAAGTLILNRGTPKQRSASRLAATLAGAALAGTLALEGAALSAGELALPLQVGGSLVASAYFLTCLWLMVALWRRRSLRLGWVSDAADWIFGTPGGDRPDGLAESEKARSRGDRFPRRPASRRNGPRSPR